MTLLSIASYLKKHYVLAICIFLVVVCSVFNFVRSEQIERLEANYDDLNVRRSRMLVNFKYSTDLAADLEVARSMKKDAEERLFHPDNLAANQRYFYQIENATGVQLNGLQQIIKPLPTGKKNKKARKKAAKAKYREIAYDMNVTGSYEQVLDYLRALEEGDAFLRLVGLSAATPRGGAGSAGTVSIQLAVEILGVKP